MNEIGRGRSAGNFLHLGLGWIGDKGGGLERYQHGICTAHSTMGHGVTAMVQSRSPVSKKDAIYELFAYASPEENRTSKLKKLKKLAAERFAAVDYIWVSHHASVSAPLLKLAGDVPHVVHFQGPWASEAAFEGAPWWKTMAQRFQEKRAYHAADRIITLSLAFKNLIIEDFGVSPDKVCVVPGALDTFAAYPHCTRNEAREQLGWPLDRPIIVSVRRLVRRVGLDVLIESMNLLKIAGKLGDVLLVIGGTGPLQDHLQSQIQEFQLQNYVRLIGYVPDEDLPLVYRAADFSIVPTQSLEGFGLVTVESLAAGTPALVTPIGSLPEIVSDLGRDLVMAGRSSQEIADSIAQHLENSNKLPSAEQCQSFVRQRYDWSVVAPQVLEVYLTAGK